MRFIPQISISTDDSGVVKVFFKIQVGIFGPLAENRRLLSTCTFASK